MTGAAKACRLVTAIFAALYVVALVLFMVGTFGLFGQTRDPLSGVFLIPLGLPWNRMIDGFPEASWPWLASAAPMINIAILTIACRVFKRASEV